MQLDLYAAIKHTVFRSALEVLFGDAAPSALPGRSYDELQADFFEFEDGFEVRCIFQIQVTILIVGCRAIATHLPVLGAVRFQLQASWLF